MERKTKAEREAQSFATYMKYNPTYVPNAANVFDYANDEDRWTDNEGDVKTCRKKFLRVVDEVAQEQKHMKRQITARIEGDTLWMFSQSFKDYGNRQLAKEGFERQIKDCKFEKVMFAICDAGGVDCWLMYPKEEIGE